MQSVSEVENEPQARFPTSCPSCRADLGGRLVRQEWVDARDIGELTDEIPSHREVLRWLRTWPGSFRVDGARGRLIPADSFVETFAEWCQPLATGSLRRSRKALARRCPACGVALGGFILPGLYAVAEVAALLGVSPRVVRRLARTGALCAFRIPGVREPVVSLDDYEAYVDHRRRAALRSGGSPR